MKHLWIGISILAAVFAVAIISGHVIASQTGVCADSLSDALSAFDDGDFPTARRHVRSAQTQWKSHRGLYASFLSHEDTEDVTMTFAELESFARLEDAEDFRACLTRLQAMLEHIIDMDRPFYHNILAAPT